MPDSLDHSTPHEAATALEMIATMRRVAVDRSLPTRWFAGALALWVGALTVAKFYDGPAVDAGTVALLIGGVLGTALWRRRLLARLQAVHRGLGTAGALTLTAGVLGILVIGDRAFEVARITWAPWATGGAVAVALFLAFELDRRAARAHLATGDA